MVLPLPSDCRLIVLLFSRLVFSPIRRITRQQRHSVRILPDPMVCMSTIWLCSLTMVVLMSRRAGCTKIRIGTLGIQKFDACMIYRTTSICIALLTIPVNLTKSRKMQNICFALHRYQSKSVMEFAKSTFPSWR